MEPNCILCDENHYPPDLCNVECIPQDNSFGHYTCDPESGDKVCLEGYTDPSTFCVEENEGKGYLLLCYFFLVPIMQMRGQAPLRELLQQFRLIRASVDALCRDGTSEISRDPRTKRLQTRRESLAMPSKHTNNNF